MANRSLNCAIIQSKRTQSVSVSSHFGFLAGPLLISYSKFDGAPSERAIFQLTGYTPFKGDGTDDKSQCSLFKERNEPAR